MTHTKTSVSKIHASDLGRRVQVFGDDGQARRPGHVTHVSDHGLVEITRGPHATAILLIRDPNTDDQWRFADDTIAPALARLRFVLFWDN